MLECKILNTDFVPICIIDDFTSIIWAERYNECGDFELYLPLTSSAVQFVAIGNYISIDKSNRLMIIEFMEINEDIEDGSQLTVKGRSLESILTRRIISTQTNMYGNVDTAVLKVLNENVISPSNPNRELPINYINSTDESITSIKVDVQRTGDEVYGFINEITTAFSFGFKMIYNKSTNKIDFQLYNGLDRTRNQYKNEYVIFGSDFNNVISSDYLENYNDYKNVALVAGEDEQVGYDRATIIVGNNDSSGFDRYEHFIDARDIQSNDGELTEEEYYEKLAERGYERLSEYSVNSVFSCDVDPNVSYVYDRDYSLGDICEMQLVLGIVKKARITEQIFSQDANGYSTYPTFTLLDDEE